MNNILLNLKKLFDKLPKQRIAASLLVSLAMVFLVCLTIIVWFRLRHRAEPFKYGVSFSAVYARELGLDWQKNFTALLDDLKIKHFRLVSYWDQIETEPGKYNFDELDWQFSEAQERGADVTLTLGLRQPRWPECRQPEWARNLSEEQWRDALYSFIEKVASRYKDRPNLDSWQLENEFFNRDFGENCRDFDRARLINEFNLVKRTDPQHPIMLNQSNQFGYPLRGPHADTYGFSIYKRVYEARLLKKYITHPMPAWYHSLRAGLIELFSGRRVIIHELQAEPWTYKQLFETELQEQTKTMSPLQLKRNLDYARSTGMKTMYLWGGEYWYWRKTTFNDPAIWETVRQEIGER